LCHCGRLNRRERRADRQRIRRELRRAAIDPDTVSEADGVGLRVGWRDGREQCTLLSCPERVEDDRHGLPRALVIEVAGRVERCCEGSDDPRRRVHETDDRFCGVVVKPFGGVEAGGVG